jgi:hypothetical protein
LSPLGVVEGNYRDNCNRQASGGEYCSEDQLDTTTPVGRWSCMNHERCVQTSMPRRRADLCR